MNKISPNALTRVIDANFNRTKEALRVCEDIARFVLSDKALSLRFKSLRHNVSLQLISFSIPASKLLEARNSRGDVGRNSCINDCRGSVNWKVLLTANLKRAQESLRVLEEVSKMINDRHSRAFQRIRFNCYELEKKSVLRF